MRPTGMDPPPPGSPKRRFPRYRADLPLTVCNHDERELDGRCFVIAEGGLGGILPEPIPVGRVVQLRLTVPTHPKLLEVWAIVRYQLEFRHGFEFVSLTEEERLSISRFCSQQAIQSGSG